jgi:hypothetical protein
MGILPSATSLWWIWSPMRGLGFVMNNDGRDNRTARMNWRAGSPACCSEGSTPPVRHFRISSIQAAVRTTIDRVVLRFRAYIQRVPFTRTPWQGSDPGGLRLAPTFERGPPSAQHLAW